MTPTTSAIHPLDHLVLPTQTVDTARIRLTALGFVVAPTGIHPFGTENCCVFLADGTYLEPLAIGSEQAATEAA
ncbi:VOC family protein, partial [Mesorhizobium sp. M8A.F.Ca.ET.021.01.1.1]